jgi:hypothetical protein
VHDDAAAIASDTDEPARIRLGRLLREHHELDPPDSDPADSLRDARA